MSGISPYYLHNRQLAKVMDNFVSMLSKLNFGIATSNAKALVSCSALTFSQSVLSLWERACTCPWPSRQPLPKTYSERIFEWNQDPVHLSKFQFFSVAIVLVLAFLHYTCLLWRVYGSAVVGQIRTCTST